MFSSAPNYTKLKTNLRLAVNRLKLLEKKKSELAQKARKEIADYLAAGKVERAKIRVEHIIREDYLVEAMEVLELYCDLLLARFGLLQQLKDLDEGIAEPVSSIIWVAPRLESDVAELRVVADILSSKYGPAYAESARTATGNHRVSEKLMHKLAIQAPPKLLVEKYLIEIAKIYKVPYEPDSQVMKEDNKPDGTDGSLIDLQDNRNNLGGSGGGGGGGNAAPPQLGFIGFPQPPPLPVWPQPPAARPFDYPSTSGTSSGGPLAQSGNEKPPGPAPFNYNIPPYPSLDQEKKDLNTDTNSNVVCDPPPPYWSINQGDNADNLDTPKPKPRTKIPPPASAPPDDSNIDDLLNLPTVPLDLPNASDASSSKPPEQKPDNDDIDFDDLSRRFEELKKRR